jgi:dienelactone hydrolase
MRTCLPVIALSLFLLTACREEPAAPVAAAPDVVSEKIAYEHMGEALEGVLFRDRNQGGKRPGVLVVHEWWGLTDHPKERARRLAELGYVAFCVDMYGKGKVTDDPAQAQAWSNRFGEDPVGFGRARIGAGLDVLLARKEVDAARIGAIGFCYGGGVVLQLAYGGADVDAVVSFHGHPAAPRDEDLPNVKSRILVCHGADDGFVPDEMLAAFEAAMKEGGLQWHLVKYGGAVHAFTNPGADAHGIDGVAYHAEADRLSWAHMRTFFEGALGR